MSDGVPVGVEDDSEDGSPLEVKDGFDDRNNFDSCDVEIFVDWNEGK